MLVTGWHTLVEFVDGMQQRHGQREAWQATERILGSGRVRVEDSFPVRDEALAIFEQMSDWNVDLSDCLSFSLMRAQGIRRAFAFDRDFEKAGFELL